MYQYKLEWKEFEVKLDRMHGHLKEVCSDYSGMVASEEELIVMLDYQNEADIIRIDDYWESRTEQEESQPTAQEIQENIQVVISKAMDFGKQLMVEFSAQNVLMGITQAGKTKEVLTFLADIKNAMDTGSLYTAIDEIDELISNGLPVELQPFITEQRLLDFKNKILSYLS